MKNPNYIEGHLNNIEVLTKNLCLCQYWGRNEVTWHYRDIKEFFREKEEDLELNTESLDGLFSDLEVPNPYLLYKAVPLPKNWKQGYKDPMFGIMFPRAKVHNTLYSLADDILGFHNKLKSDYSLYRTFKSYLVRNLNKLQSNKELLKSFKTNLQELPKHLDIFEISNRLCGAPNTQRLQVCGMEGQKSFYSGYEAYL